MPSTVDKWMPALWSLVTALAGAFGIWAANEPDSVAQLKIPAALVAVASAVAATKKATSNTDAAAKAVPDHLAGDDGHLDLGKTLAKLLANAAEDGDIELVKSLTALIPQGGKR